MHKISWRILAPVGLLVALLPVTSTQAQGPITGAPIRLKPLESGRIEGKPLEDTAGAFRGLRRTSGLTRIVGMVMTSNGVIVPSAGVVMLRSLTTGRVVGQVSVDPLGQFGLAGFEPGMYVAEVVDMTGSVIATSPAFTVGLSELVQVAPIIPVNPLTSFAYWAGNGAATAVNTATSAGVIAVTEGTDITNRE